MKGTPEFLMKSRKKLGLTVEEMAYELSISEPMYKFLEYGEPLWDTKPLRAKVREMLNVHKHRLR
jgi:predicted transcriptional regulator